MYGKQLKKLINDNISDNDIVCFGEKGDALGRYDHKIIGIEKRQVGFDQNNTYKVIKKDTKHISDITTEYEDKFMSIGKNINYISVVKE